MSFNIACGITGLPIESDDEAILFVIEPCYTTKPYGEDIQIHADAMYRPVWVPIRVRHDDCGYFEPVGDGIERAAAFLAALNAVLNKSWMPDIANWSEFIDKNRNRFEFPGCDNVGGPVIKTKRAYHLYVVHPEAFEIAMTSREGARLLEWKIKNFNNGIEQSRETIERWGTTTGATREQWLEVESARLAAEFTRSTPPHIRSIDLMASMTPVAKKAIEENKPIAIEDVPTQIRELILFQYGLEAMNHRFAPGIYTGDGFDFDLAAKLHRATAQMLKKKAADIDLDIEVDDSSSKNRP